MAVLVVACLFVRIAEYGISLGSLLELLLCLFVARILVRVLLDGHFPVGLLYFFRCGVTIHAKHLIIISFLCHGSISKSDVSN